jgi:hypothetical protein
VKRMKSYLMETGIVRLIVLVDAPRERVIAAASSSMCGPCAQFRWSGSMRAPFLAIAVLCSALVSGNAVGNAAPIKSPGFMVYGNAPIGHLQPHAQQFSPNSPAVETEQELTSRFNAQQQKQDEKLDKGLNICRC